MNNITNGEREFNPYQYGIVEDSEEELEVLLPPRIEMNENELDWPAIPDEMQIDVSKYFDGVLILGKSWDIVQIDGVQRLQRYPTVFSRRPSAYKGLDRFLSAYHHIFEFQLLMINDLTMCVLVCTKTRLRTVRGINPAKLSEACREGIRKAIRVLPQQNTTRIDLEHHLDGHIAVHAADWGHVGQYLQWGLKEISRANPALFPPTPEFWFIAKRFGQDIVFERPGSIQCLNGVQPSQTAAIVIHCAFDHTIPNSILWWKTEKLRACMSHAPKGGIHRVGIYPGLGNCTFLRRDLQFPQVTYYTRIYHHIHRDELRLLWSNDVTIIMANIYAHFLNRIKKPIEKSLSQKIRALKEDKLTNMVRNMPNYIPNNVPARVEFVTCFSGMDLRRPGISMSRYIDIAFALSERNLLEGGFSQKCRNMLYAMDIESFRERSKTLLTPICNTMTNIIGRIFEMDKYNNIFEATCLMVTNDDIHKLYICNAVLRFLFRGSFIYGFPTWVKNYLEVSESYLRFPTIQTQWPFRNVKVNSQFIELDKYGEHAIPKLPKILEGYMPMKYKEIMTIYREYEHAATDDRRNIVILLPLASQLAAIITDFAVLSSLRKHESNTRRIATLQILWGLHLRNRTEEWKSSITFFNDMCRRGERDTVEVRGIAPIHEHLITIIRMASDLVSYQLDGTSFRMRCAIALEELMIQQKCPFRFLFNQRRIIVVLPTGMGGQIPKEFSYIWRTAFFKRYEKQLPDYFTERLRNWCNNATDEERAQIDVSKVLEYLSVIRSDYIAAIPSTRNPAFRSLCKYLREGPANVLLPPHAPTPTSTIISEVISPSHVGSGYLDDGAPESGHGFQSPNSTNMGTRQSFLDQIVSAGDNSQDESQCTLHNPDSGINNTSYRWVRTPIGSSQSGTPNSHNSTFMRIITNRRLPLNGLISTSNSSSQPRSTIAFRVRDRIHKGHLPTPSTSSSSGFRWSNRANVNTRRKFSL